MPVTYPTPPPIGLKLKLRRARKQLRQLRRTFDRFVVNHPATWRREVNAERTHYLYSLVPPEAPEEVQLIADEAIHHLRSSLDHLITAFVESYGGRVTKQNQFPILQTKPRTDDAIRRFDESIGRVRGRAREIIVEAQPYLRGDGAQSHPLWILSQLDNRFKHTSLHLLVFQIRAPMPPGTVARPVESVRNSGDVFAEVPISINVEEVFEPYISVRIAFGFQRLGIENVGLDTLDEIYDFVRDEIFRKALRGRLPPRLQPRR